MPRKTLFDPAQTLSRRKIVITGMAQSRCCPLQSPRTGLPSFGIALLSPSSSASSSTSPHPLLHLLGLTDQELQEQMAKGHIYAFNMGNNNIIPFRNFQEAGKVLLKRNMPEVLDGSQTVAVFMPEAHLPSNPMVVDEQSYQAKKMRLDAPSLKFLGMIQGTQDSQNARGDLAEIL